MSADILVSSFEAQAHSEALSPPSFKYRWGKKGMQRTQSKYAPTQLQRTQSVMSYDTPTVPAPLRSPSDTRSTHAAPLPAPVHRLKDGEVDVSVKEASSGMAPKKSALRLGTMDSSVLALKGESPGKQSLNPLDSLASPMSTQELLRKQSGILVTPVTDDESIFRGRNCRLLLLILIINNLALIGLMCVITWFLAPSAVPPLISGGNLGDLTVLHTTISSPRSDMHLQLESNLGVQLRPAANADLEMQVSGTGRARVGTVSFGGSSVQSSAQLQLVAAQDITLAPSPGSVVAQAAVRATAGLSATAITAGGVTATALTATAVSASTLTANSVSAAAVTSQSVSTAGAVTAAGGLTTAATVSAAGGFTTPADITARSAVLSTSLNAPSAVIANLLTAGDISSNSLTSSSLSAAGVAAGTVTATGGVTSTATITAAGGFTTPADITARSAVLSTSVSAPSAVIANLLTAGDISSSSVTASSLSAAGIAARTVTATGITAVALTAGAVEATSLSASGALTSASATVTGLASTGSVSTGALTAAGLTAASVAAGSFSTNGGLTANTATVTALLQSGSMSTPQLTATALTATSASVASLSAAGSISAASLSASGALTANTATVTDLMSSGSVSTSALTATSVTTAQLTATSLTATTMTGATLSLSSAITAVSTSLTGALTANSAAVTNLLSSGSFNTGALTATALTASSLTAGSVSTPALTATSAVAGSLSSTGTITANAAVVTTLMHSGSVSTGPLTATTAQVASVTSSGAVTASSVSVSGSLTANALTAVSVNSGTITTTSNVLVGGAVTATSFSGFGVVPIGSIIAHYPDLTNADSVASARAAGFATCDGTTPASQGIASPVITAATPNLNSGRFLRGAAPGSSGTLQSHAFQGHIHSTSTAGAHTHTLSSNGTHSHTEFLFQLTNCDYCGGCSFKANDCTGKATSAATTLNGDHTHAMTTAGDHTHTISTPITDGVNGTPNTASETRPDNMSVVWLIRVR